MAIPLRILLLALFVHALWGGNVVGIKFGLLAIPPILSAFFRFVLGSACLVAWARAKGVPLRPPPEERLGLLVLGVLFTVQIALLNVGASFTTAGMGSVLISTNPLFAALFAHLFIPGDRLSPWRSLGLVIAFAGIVLIFSPDLATPTSLRVTWGNLIVLASATLLGGRLVFTARLLRVMNQTRVVVWQMLISLPLFGAWGFAFERIDWAALDWRPVAGIGYQGIVIAGFAFMMAAWLMKNYQPSVVLSFNFAAPVFGVLFSVLIWGEPVTWQLLAGMAAVGFGLFLIARRQAPAPTAPSAPREAP